MQYDLCAKLLNEALFILRKQLKCLFPIYHGTFIQFCAAVQKESGNPLCVDMEQSQKYHVK